MQHLHAHKVVHGDVTLSNVAYDNSEKKAKLFDFGYAARPDSEWRFQGTPEYLPPSYLMLFYSKWNLLGEPVTDAEECLRDCAEGNIFRFKVFCDWYAMSCVLYAMFSRYLVFDFSDIEHKSFEQISKYFERFAGEKVVVTKEDGEARLRFPLLQSHCKKFAKILKAEGCEASAAGNTRKIGMFQLLTEARHIGSEQITKKNIMCSA